MLDVAVQPLLPVSSLDPFCMLWPLIRRAAYARNARTLRTCTYIWAGAPLRRILRTGPSIESTSDRADTSHGSIIQDA